MSHPSKNPKDILDGLKAAGGRTTAVRTAVVEAFAAATSPITAAELGDALGTKGLKPNKTSLYREIAHLTGSGVLLEIRLGDRAVRYELKGDDHHHHVVCISCDKVVDVELAQDLDAEERAISRKTGYSILRHSLEFFGLCEKCR